MTKAMSEASHEEGEEIQTCLDILRESIKINRIPPSVAVAAMFKIISYGMKNAGFSKQIYKKIMKDTTHFYCTHLWEK